jgi:hypothetical protein
MNEQQFANKIRQALNEGSRVNGHLSARVAERLREARERALERRRPERAPVLGWAQLTTDGVVARFGGLGGFSLRLLLPTALLVAGLLAIYSWQREQRAADVEELDAQLLTDELPIDAYLDRGFEAWLKKTSSR